MRVLKSLGVTLWKEWRDHRVMVIAIFLALPVLTGVAFWAFGRQLIGSQVHTQLMIFLPVALGLVFFSIAADLVSGEKRRKTLDLLRRLPGGLTRTFAIKWVFLLVVTLSAMLWQVLVLAFAWNVMAAVGADGGYDGHKVSDEILGQLSVFPRSLFWQLTLVSMVLPPWAFVVSTWLGRSGAAAIASLLVLAGLLAPWALLIMQYPWFFPFGPQHVPAIAGTLVALAVLVSAVSYLGGLRFHGAVWKPGLFGLAAVLVLTGAGYAYARVELHRWIEFDQHDPDLYIKGALVAEGGNSIYLNVSKGHPWQAGKPVGGGSGTGAFIKHKGSPVQTWIFSRKTGRVTRDTSDGRHEFGTVDYNANSRWSGLQQPLLPHRIVTRVHADRNDFFEYQWIDATTNEVIDTFDRIGTRSPAVDAALREDARRYGAHVDSQGRRVWIRDGLMERDGELPPLADRVHVVPRENRGWSIRNPVGWTRTRMVFEDNKFVRTEWMFHDAETGATHEMTCQSPDGRWRALGSVLDRSFALKTRDPHWGLVDLMTGESRGVAKNPPRYFNQVIGERRVLGTYVNESGHLELRIWNPVSGETWPLSMDTGPVDRGSIDNGPHVVGSNFSVRGRAADGRLVVSALVIRENVNHYWIGVVDPKAMSIRTIAVGPGWPWTSIRPLVLEDDGALMAIAHNREIVRIGPAMNERTVVFPR